MGGYTPIYQPGAAIGFTAGGTITGGQVVILSAAGGSQSNGTVTAAAAATDTVIGVAADDAVSGQRVTVYGFGPVHELTASAAITAGTPVKAASSGRVAAWVSGTDNASLIRGIALTTTTAADQKIRVMSR